MMVMGVTAAPPPVVQDDLWCPDGGEGQRDALHPVIQRGLPGVARVAPLQRHLQEWASQRGDAVQGQRSPFPTP